MIFRAPFNYDSVFSIVQPLVPDELQVIEIETWKHFYCRVKAKTGTSVTFFMVDLESKSIIYNEGDHIQVAGSYLKLKRNGKEGLIDVEKHYTPHLSYIWRVIIPCAYSRIVDVLDGKGLVRVIKDDGKWGIIDRFNRVIVPFDYYHISPLYPSTNGKYHIIVRKAEVEPEYNMFIAPDYSLEKGNTDVPILTGEVLCII